MNLMMNVTINVEKRHRLFYLFSSIKSHISIRMVDKSGFKLSLTHNMNKVSAIKLTNYRETLLDIMVLLVQRLPTWQLWLIQLQ